jgi:hypothetical protein
MTATFLGRLLLLCLVEDHSLFSQNSLWTAELVNEVYRAFVKHPDFGKDDFVTKLKRQMQPASAATPFAACPANEDIRRGEPDGSSDAQKRRTFASQFVLRRPARRRSDGLGRVAHACPR